MSKKRMHGWMLTVYAESGLRTAKKSVTGMRKRQQNERLSQWRAYQAFREQDSVFLDVSGSYRC